MTEELKPCPFCGSSRFEYGYWGWIGCQECGAKVAGHGAVDPRGAWNHRAAPAQPEGPWHDAVLSACMSIEGAYNPADPVATLRALIDWHVANERGAQPEPSPGATLPEAQGYFERMKFAVSGDVCLGWNMARQELQKFNEGRPDTAVEAGAGAEEDERSIIDTYKALHEGKLGAHWLWCVIEQIAAGVPEDEAFAGYGYYEPGAQEDEPYGWHYFNKAGASVLHLERSPRLDADMDAAKNYPQGHWVVAVYAHPSRSAGAAAPADALAKLRHLYANMIGGGVRDTASAERIATGLLGPAIEALEAGAAAPVEGAAWRDIETAPVGELVLVCGFGLDTQVATKPHRDVARFWASNGAPIYPDHWMPLPLPAAPKETK